MKILTDENYIETLHVDGIIIGAYENNEFGSAASRLRDNISSVIALGDFEGKDGQNLLLYNVDECVSPRVVLVGLGQKDKANHETVRKASGKSVKQLRDLGCKSIAIESLHGDGQSVAEGVVLGLHRFDELKTLESKKKKIVDEVIFCGNPEEISTWKNGVVIADSQNVARRLSELPANFATPTYFCNSAKELLDSLENTYVISHDEKWAKDKKMNVFLSVTQGTDEPAKFLEIKYSGGNEGDQPLVLVGKGITFDSGGLSLKTNREMEWMRGDCCGAAAVIGSILAIAKLKLPMNIIGLAPFTENLPSGKSTKPTDVFYASNGKSVLIGNTDSEGRLVLADALVYSETFNPHTVIDIATLTGSVEHALGTVFTGTFTPSDDLWHELHQAGEESYERLWRLPMDERYREALDTPLADMNNTGGSAFGGGSIGAMFLREFISIERWAHLDIAGSMLSEKETEYYPQGMRGSPVRALVQFAINISLKSASK